MGGCGFSIGGRGARRGNERRRSLAGRRGRVEDGSFKRDAREGAGCDGARVVEMDGVERCGQNDADCGLVVFHCVGAETEEDVLVRTGSGGKSGNGVW